MVKDIVVGVSLRSHHGRTYLAQSHTMSPPCTMQDKALWDYWLMGLMGLMGLIGYSEIR